MSRPKRDPAGHPTRSLRAVPERAQIVNPPERPDRPTHLGAHGRRTWDALWDAGGDAGAYQPTDRFIIERYCRLVQDRAELRETVRAEGHLAEGSQGQPVVHPAAKLLRQIEKDLLPLEDRLGLSPEARARLNLSLIEEQTSLDRFLAGSRRGRGRGGPAAPTG